MLPKEYAERLRSHGHSYQAIKVLVSLVYGKPVSLWTVYYWLNPKRRKQIRDYQREWQRKHRAKAGKKPGKPVVDRQKFNTHGPFKEPEKSGDSP
jgi:hypothetical protein